MSPEVNPDEVKQCCAAIYQGDAARLLLGESFHPGGLALTEHLGTLLQLGHESHMLDVAAGTGASALHLAEKFGCRVTGLDLSAENIARAQAEAASRGLGGRVQFRIGDAERLPFADASFDALICECAFCTFPSKLKSAEEFARVLRPGGCAGLSDLTRSGALPGELQDLMAWIACIADAQPIEHYQSILSTARLQTTATEIHDEALEEMVRQIRDRLLTLEIAKGLGRIELPELDLGSAARMAKTVYQAVRQGKLGYVLLIATKGAPATWPLENK